MIVFKFDFNFLWGEGRLELLLGIYCSPLYKMQLTTAVIYIKSVRKFTRFQAQFNNNNYKNPAFVCSENTTYVFQLGTLVFLHFDLIFMFPRK